MQLVINMPKEMWERIKDGYVPLGISKYLKNGIQLPEGHGFLAICDSDFPITEDIKQELKNTVFVGDEDCRYCFDMTEIIEADEEAKHDS